MASKAREVEEVPTGPRALPGGFTLKTVPTSCGGHKYDVEVAQGGSLQAYLDAYKALGRNGEEIILAILNSGNEQGAKQGQKDLVRKALEEFRAESDEVAAAVGKHQETAKQFIQGAPRGGGGPRHESGLTKKEREAFGGAVATEMASTGSSPSQDRLTEIAKTLGINPSLLGL